MKLTPKQRILLQKKLLDKGLDWEEISHLKDKALEIKTKRKKDIVPHGWMQKMKKNFPEEIMTQDTYSEIRNIDDNAQLMLHENKFDKTLRGSTVLDKKVIVAKVMEKLALPQPPKSWVKNVVDGIKKKNPGISEDSAGKIMGDMWYNSMDNSSRSRAKKKYKD